MKTFIQNIIPSVSICFTLTILLNLILNIINGYTADPFVFYLFAFLVVSQGIDALISLIDFKKWSHYCITESVILYAISLLFFSRYLFYNGTVDPYRLIAATIIFILVITAIFSYFRKRRQLQADEINELIAGREN